MKYMILNYREEAPFANMTEEERMQELADINAFTKYAREHATILGGEPLYPTSAATTVRVRDGKTLTTDGPFAETREALAGFFVIDCKDLAEAIEIASKIPVARQGSVEIRPVPVIIFD